MTTQTEHSSQGLQQDNKSEKLKQISRAIAGKRFVSESGLRYRLLRVAQIAEENFRVYRLYLPQTLTPTIDLVPLDFILRDELIK
ncbi:hypothetical protein J4233_03020 [Candidatus Pacearchaeota archaeon]|nr:hypothetical protein [Candidatus Pacearchaeota archaeon]